METKIWVAVPAYTGSITVETARALQAETYEALKRKWPYLVQYFQQEPYIDYARNLLVREFLDGDFTDLIFVDDDVAFPMGTLCQLASYEEDIVGAVYTHRNDGGTFPVRFIEERTELWSNENGLIEVAGLPTGCMRIKRHVLETMVKNHPELLYGDRNGIDTYALFACARQNGTYYGEDFYFCNLARADGFKIWMAPDIDMTHTGTKVYKGNVAKWLKGRMNPPMENIMQFAAKAELKREIFDDAEGRN